jgi:malate dehydrogenase
VDQGRAIQDAASSGVRIVVVGNPCNTNCLIAMHNAPNIANDQWSAMTQLDHNRAKAQLAARAGTTPSQVRRPIIWGNHSNTQYPDWSFATIGGKPAPEVIGDRNWYENEFIGTVQERGKAVIDARGASSAMSAANAAIEHSRNLFQGTPYGDWTSMAVRSDGSYGVPEGLISSFPVTCPGDGTTSIVRDLEMDDFGKERLARSVTELTSEREVVADLLG